MTRFQRFQGLQNLSVLFGVFGVFTVQEVHKGLGGFKVFGVLGFQGFQVFLGSGQGFGLRFEGSKFIVWGGLGFRVLKVLGFGVWGLGFKNNGVTGWKIKKADNQNFGWGKISTLGLLFGQKMLLTTEKVRSAQNKCQNSMWVKTQTSVNCQEFTQTSSSVQSRQQTWPNPSDQSILKSLRIVRRTRLNLFFFFDAEAQSKRVVTPKQAHTKLGRSPESALASARYGRHRNLTSPSFEQRKPQATEEEHKADRRIGNVHWLRTATVAAQLDSSFRNI